MQQTPKTTKKVQAQAGVRISKSGYRAGSKGFFCELQDLFTPPAAEAPATPA